MYEAPAEDAKELAEVETPKSKTIADVCAFLNMPMDKSVKAVVLTAKKHGSCFCSW